MLLPYMMYFYRLYFLHDLHNLEACTLAPHFPPDQTISNKTHSFITSVIAHRGVVGFIKQIYQLKYFLNFCKYAVCYNTVCSMGTN